MTKPIRQAGAKNPGWFAGSEGRGAKNVPSPAPAAATASPKEPQGSRPAFPSRSLAPYLDIHHYRNWRKSTFLTQSVVEAAAQIDDRDLAEARDVFVSGRRSSNGSTWIHPVAGREQIAELFEYQAGEYATEVLDMDLRDAGCTTEELLAARNTDEYQACHSALSAAYSEAIADAALEKISGRVLIGNHDDDEFWVADINPVEYARAMDRAYNGHPFPVMAVGYRLRYRKDDYGQVIVGPDGRPEREVFTENMVIRPEDLVRTLGDDASGNPVVISREDSRTVVDPLPELDSERMQWSREQSSIVLKNQMAARYEREMGEGIARLQEKGIRWD